jgi:hypothetical protein
MRPTISCAELLATTLVAMLAVSMPGTAAASGMRRCPGNVSATDPKVEGRRSKVEG